MKIKKAVTWILVCAVLLALVLWLGALPLPLEFTLSGVQVNERGETVEPVTLEVDCTRRYRFMRPTEVEGKAIATFEDGSVKEYDLVWGLWENRFEDAPIRFYTGFWYNGEINDTRVVRLFCDVDHTMAVLEIHDEAKYVVSRDGLEPQTVQEALRFN